MRSGVKTVLSSRLFPRSVRFVFLFKKNTADPYALILQKKMMMMMILK